MKFPRNTKELDEIFKTSSLPEIPELEGEYLVNMLLLVANRILFPDSKIFYTEDGKAVGHNRLFNNLKWGRFFLEKGTSRKLASLPVIVINYDMPENTFLTRGIRDEIRRVRKDIYLGRFNMLLKGKLCFLGYFSLVKK
jgi:hypothetical protein